MKQAALNDNEIIVSWHKNAGPWIEAVRRGKIESRVSVTNRAIVDAIRAQSPQSILDIGCGEGWLARELAPWDIDVLGVDAVPELIDAANQTGHGKFRLMSYEDLSPDLLHERFDLIVCNFSLLGKESVERVFAQASKLLNKYGALVVQTLHPVYTGGAAEYLDGWRQGSWDGFGDEFNDPAPWYFRTMDSWKMLFTAHGFDVVDLIEPANPLTDLPVSVIMIGRQISNVSTDLLSG